MGGESLLPCAVMGQIQVDFGLPRGRRESSTACESSTWCKANLSQCSESGVYADWRFESTTRVVGSSRLHEDSYILVPC